MPNIGSSEVMDVFKGINNVLPADKSLDGYLKELVNLDIDKNNNLSKRLGYVLKDAAKYHSLWSDNIRMFGVRNGDLVEIKADGSFSTLQTGLGDNNVSFDVVDSIYYYVSKFKTGKIVGTDVQDLGIVVPQRNFILSSSQPGKLAKGFYQINITYSYANKVESGTSIAGVIEVPEGSSITVSNLQFPVGTNPEVTAINIYATYENGDDFYRVGSLPSSAASTSFVVSDTHNSDYPLRTYGLHEAPRGSIVKYAHGRLYIAQDNLLWWSEPYMYDHYKLKESYFYFEDEITAVCPTPDGLWISSDKIYYVAGKNPTQARLTEKELAQVVRGSDVKFSGAYIFIENTPLGYKWLVTTDKGMFVLFNDGVILNISEQNVAMPKAWDAASGFIQEDGINRYVSLLREKENSQNTAIGDLVTSTIIRNGITIT